MPPRLPARIARWCLSSFEAERLLDALDDEYGSYQLEARGRRGADLWYWRQVLASLPPLLRRRRPVGRGSLRMDLRHLLRRLARAPVSAGAAIITLSLTLGAGTAVFAVVDAVILRPPPFADPGAVVTIGLVRSDNPAGSERVVTNRVFRIWRERAGSGARLEAYDPTNLTLTGLGIADRVSALDVTPGFLDMLGVSTMLGRGFERDDVGGSMVIISSGFWHGRMGGDRDVLGRVIELGNEPHTVVGVLPQGFAFELNPSEVWRVLPAASGGVDREGDPVRVMGRLVDHSTADELETALTQATPEMVVLGAVRATPVSVALAGDSARTLRMLGVAVAVAILIAFINLTVLLMVRTIDRRRELAVRRALGARPSESSRQLVIEAIALVGLGIIGGVLLASLVTPVVSRFAFEFGGLAERDVAVGWRPITVVSLASLVLAVACGLLPTVGFAHRRRVSDILRRGATSSAREVTFRRTLVTGEVALAFVLLTTMSLLTTSLISLLRTDPGFDADGLLKLQLALPAAGYPSPESTAGFYSQLQRALEKRLGPRTVAVVDEIPLTGDGGRRLLGESPTALDREVVIRTAGPGYFDVLGVSFSSGRAFEWSDSDQVPPRAVVTHSLAQRLLGSGPLVGRALWIDGVDVPVEIIGVVADVKHRALDEAPLPTAYLSLLQFPSPSSVLTVRSDRPQAAVVSIVREEVARLDADLPVYRIGTMRAVIAASPGVPGRRLLAVAMISFAFLALTLSAIGLFGVAAHDVARRRPELALRSALGANPARVLTATLRTGVHALGWGLAVGAALSTATVRQLGPLLYGAGKFHVVAAVTGTAGLLTLIGLIAILPSALSAARSDPMTIVSGD